MSATPNIDGKKTPSPSVTGSLKIDSHQVLESVLEHLPDALLLTDFNGQVMLANTALEQMTGRPAATLVGKPLPSALAPGIGPIIGLALDDTSEPALGEIKLDDGRQIGVRASVIEGQKGEIAGVLTTLRDVSRHRAAERIQDAVLTTISHELRTPLASVLGFTALAAKTLNERLAPHISLETPKAQRALTRMADHLQRIEESGQRLEQMINDLLDLADMEAGRIDWDMADVSLVEAIHAAVLAMTPQAEAKNLPIHLSLSPNLPAARGDRGRLLRVITDLLSNAIKFTDKGEIQISARTWQRGDNQVDLPISVPPGDYILASVADTGQGIPPESLPHLFEKFFQTGTSLTDKPSGAGLGLALSREIIEHHGGHIWAESEPGIGSTFYFTLPWDPQALPAEPLLVRELRRWAAASIPEATVSPAILVAHSDAELQQLLRKELESPNQAIFYASNRQQCRHILETESPPLLVLDPFLPGTSDLYELSLPTTLLLAIVTAEGGGLRVAMGEMMPTFAGADLALRSLPSHLALAWDDDAPECRLLVLNGAAPSLGGVTETLQAQGFESVISRRADQEGPDQAILEAVLGQLQFTRIRSNSRYRNPQRDLCNVVLIEL